MEAIVHDDTLASLKDRTVIVGCPGAGSVAQLAADLLIATLSLSYRGAIHSPGLCPFAGPDPYGVDPELVASAADVYCSRTAPLAVLAFRSPVCGRFATDLSRNLASALVDAGVKRVVWMTGFVGSEKHTVESTPFGRVSNGRLSAEDARALSSLEWEARDPSDPVRGGRFAKKSHDACTALGLPSVVFFKYCYEGDNVVDAEDTLRQLNRWLRLFPEDRRFVTPASWNFLYGRPIPDSLY